MSSESVSQLRPDDLWYFNEGTERFAYRHLGAAWSPAATRFAVWAPNATRVTVIGDFNGWVPTADAEMHPTGSSGVWQVTIDLVQKGNRYKFRIVDRYGRTFDKADPYATACESAPATASIIAAPEWEWSDEAWMRSRSARNATASPISIYEVHLGSWGRTVSGSGRFPTYVELGDALAQHVGAHGFTHVELMPVMEHPFYGSWGYQTIGYFAPTARFGPPEGFMEMVDRLHNEGIGVILDWVPSHFPTDDFALADFDGTSLYEYADPREGFHPDWNSAIFNYSRHEVRSFLISSAISWLDRYHVDGLRVDAVASMLYRDYSRRADQWIPNRFGGRENLEAISFLQQLNLAVNEEFPGVATFAEESTAFPGVTAPVSGGGLGFAYKWDMGWMHDTLGYFRHDPIHRRWHHDELTFRAVYAFSEKYTLPLSHDEVVHAKGSILDQMPGDTWQEFANLRVLYGYQWTSPGKKLLFMGNELAPRGDWAHESVLDWSLHDVPENVGIRHWISALNTLYRNERALHDGDCDPAGFEWVDNTDSENSVIAFLRLPTNAATSAERGVAERGVAERGVVEPHESESDDARCLLVVLNATPIPRSRYRVGVPLRGEWRVLLDSDATTFGGSGWMDAQVDSDAVFEALPVPYHGRPDSMEIELPPLSMVVLKPYERDRPGPG